MVFKYLRYLLRVLVCFWALAVSSVAYSATFSDLYIFGDSLSDTTAGPSGTGLSNGILWPEYFAPQVGALYKEGNNYAVSGAITTDLAFQVSSYQGDNITADPNALYVIWAGGNDILTDGNGTNAANNVINSVNNLSAYGAVNFLIPNMFDIGLSPMGTSGMTTASIAFNSTLENEYSSSANVVIADMFGFHHDLISNPEAFGLTNAADSCLNTSANCETYFLWDYIHPTTVGHSLVADELKASVVPVPAAVWLFASGLLGLVGVARRNKAV